MQKKNNPRTGVVFLNNLCKHKFLILKNYTMPKFTKKVRTNNGISDSKIANLPSSL